MPNQTEKCLSSTHLFNLDDAIYRAARCSSSPRKRSSECLFAPSLEAILMCLRLLRSLWNRIRLLKSLNIPWSPRCVWSWCWPLPPPLFSFGLKEVYLVQAQYFKILPFFPTHALKSLFYSWNKRTWKSYFLQSRKSWFQTTCRTQKSTTGLGIKVTSICGQQSSV